MVTRLMAMSQMQALDSRIYVMIQTETKIVYYTGYKWLQTNKTWVLETPKNHICDCGKGATKSLTMSPYHVQNITVILCLIILEIRSKVRLC